MLVNKPPICSPERAILHHQDVVTSSYKIMGEVRLWAVAVFGTPFIEQLLHNPSVCDNHCSSCSQLQGVQPPILFSPFSEPLTAIRIASVVEDTLFTYFRYDPLVGI